MYLMFVVIVNICIVIAMSSNVVLMIEMRVNMSMMFVFTATDAL